MSFRFKTIIGIAIIEGLLLMLLIWVGMAYLNDSNRQALADQASSTIKLFVSLTKESVLSTDLASLEAAATELLSRPGIKYVRIDSQGETLIEKGDTKTLTPYSPENTGPELTNDGVFDITEPINVAGQSFGNIYLGISTLEIESLLDEAQNKFLSIAALEMVLVALFSYILGVYLTKSLSRLQTGVISISEGDLGAQVEVHGNDELASTAQAFNIMSQRLQASNHEMKQSVNESKKLAASLKQSELRTRTILNTAVDGFVIINDRGIIQDINTAGARIFGYQTKEIIGRNVSCLMPEPYQSEHDGYLHNYLTGGEPKVIGIGREVIGLRQDGSTFPMDLSISEMLLGTEQMFVGLVRDISEKQAIEAVARRNEALKSAIFDSSLDALITINIDDSIVEFSAVAEEMFGYSREDVLGKEMANLIIPVEFREAHYNGMKHYIKTGEAKVLCKRIELTAMRSTGEVFPVEATISPIEVSGNKLFTASLRDISDYKQWETQLKDAREKAESASEAKSRFLAHMSHEIRSPLNAILGSLDLLRDSELDHEQTSYTLIARTSGKALLGVINDVLDFSKIEAGEMSLNEKNFSTIDLIEGVLEVINYRAHDKPVDVASTIVPDLPSIIHGDPVRIRQVLINLMDNAIKFTNHGAVVLNVSVTHCDNNKITIRFSVEDTGSGIPDEAKDFLFDEFSQVDNSDVTSFGGTGLGLAICKQLVMLMNGQIGVDSTIGKGSHFWFELPLTLADYDVTPVLPQRFNNRVLVVGLSRLARNAIHHQAEVLGCHSETAACGRDALKKIIATRNNPYDYVIIDEMINDIELSIFIKRVQSEGMSHLVLIPAGNIVNSDYAHKRGLESILMRPFHIGNLMSVLTSNQDIQLIEKTQIQEHVNQHDAIQARILLAEDSVANQMIAVSVLEKSGYIVDVANDGKEAVDKFQNDTYDLILMDLRMPNMSGLEATEVIRKLSGGVNIPIIAMTANALQADINRCFESGMNDYISKPFERNHLINTINHWLAKTNAPADLATNTTPKNELASKPAIVDNSIFEHLANDTSHELVPEMVNMFMAECRSRIEIINNQMDDISLLDIRDQIHTVKSLAGTFGTPRLETLAREIEQACIDEDLIKVHKLGILLNSLYEETVSLYQKLFTEYMFKTNKGLQCE